MTSDETLWAVHTNSDLTEGRGRQYVKYFCRTKATAYRLGRGGYVQGSDCPVSEVKVLNLDGKHVLPTSLIRIEEPTPEDMVTQKHIDAREYAINKAKSRGLTDEEIKLLGFQP